MDIRCKYSKKISKVSNSVFLDRSFVSILVISYTEINNIWKGIMDPANAYPSSESNGAGGVWMGGPGDLGKPSVDQSFWERALIWI